MTDTTQTSTRFDSVDTSIEDDRHTITTYLADMLAVERHIRISVDRQLNDETSAKYPEAAELVRQLRTLIDQHETALKARHEALGGDGGAGVKSAITQLLGGAAAAVGLPRKRRISKDLRDDYTALGLASISYTMLHTTALGLGDEATATLAKRHLDDYAPLVIAISRTMPALVLQELRDDGESVQVSAADLAAQNTSESWRQSS